MGHLILYILKWYSTTEVMLLHIPCNALLSIPLFEYIQWFLRPLEILTVILELLFRYGGGADFPFFQTYFSKRLMRPEDDVHLLDPQSLWSIWNWLQSQSKWPLLPNPPSSGFLGVVMAMLHCNKVNFLTFPVGF